MDEKKTILRNLLAIAEAYRKATDQSMTAVSKKFYGKGNFFDQVRLTLNHKGKRRLSIDSLTDMLAMFRKEWPEGAEWPMTRAITMGFRPKD